MRTRTGTPSAAKISDLQIWLSSQPIAAAASAAVRVASGKRRTWPATSPRPSSRRASADRGWAAEPSLSVAEVVMRGTVTAGTRWTETRKPVRAPRPHGALTGWS